jgi:hypothetical protein
VNQESVEDALERLDAGHVDLEQKAVLARDAVALADLSGAFSQLGDLGYLAGAGLQSHPRRDRQAEGSGIEIETVAPNDPGGFEASEAFPYSGRRHPDPAGKLSDREPGIGGQHLQQPPVRPINK